MPETTDSTSEGYSLSFTDHLEELRTRIIICVVFFILAFVFSFIFAPRAVGWLMLPLTHPTGGKSHTILTLHLAQTGEIDSWKIAPPDDLSADFISSKAPVTTDAIKMLATDSFRLMIEGIPEPIEIGPKVRARLTYLTPLEPFMLWLQGALLLSAVVAIPMVVYQFWLFISPGLLRRERHAIGPLLLASILLFPMGAAFAYTISHVTIQALQYFGDAIPGLEPDLVASRSVKFILVMMFMFGIVFEFPLLLLLLSRLGVVNARTLTRQRRMAIVVMAVVAAVATPSPDPISMLLMLAPMVLLYEGSIFVIRLMERGDRKLENQLAAQSD